MLQWSWVSSYDCPDKRIFGHWNARSSCWRALDASTIELMAKTAAVRSIAPAHRSHASHPQTITVRAVPAAPAKHKGGKEGGHRRAGSLVSNMQNLGGFALAGFLLAQLDKQAAIPTIPVIGKAGTIAVALHYLGKGNKMMQEGSLAAAAIAGYEFGQTGHVSGGRVVKQVSGVAAQV
jgi:hypothetical protein